MQSGAGHDAQEIAEIAPAGMIFIPSRLGISHLPKEFSTTTDMANGCNVLLQTILKIDKQQQSIHQQKIKTINQIHQHIGGRKARLRWIKR